MENISNLINFIVICAFLVGILKGYKKGFLLELSVILSFLAAFILTPLFYSTFVSFFRKLLLYIAPATISNLLYQLPFFTVIMNSIAFSIIFYICRTLAPITRLLSKTAFLSKDSPLNRILGAAFGCIHPVMDIWTIFFLLSMMPQSISDQIRDLLMQSDVLRILYNTNIFLYIWDYIKISISMNSLYIFHIITAYPLT